ncbi:aspartic proteinase CDR1-like [Rhododendron vialii]|uniref:aspartic proteinase CDR1-like n=1 Tax=Rhododendron vialii TaxID=182163 RepID=UPI00265FE62D|nr:aspartic proteinase CDR1-like [Rhododendron vialii]
MATIFNSLPLFSIFIIQLIVLSSAGGGFTVDLIHRDSPKSPFYDPSASRTDRLTNAVRRSFTRAASHSRKQNCLAPNNIQSEIIPASGEYLMKISIGTPRFQVLVIADTGSDITWTQCKPCKNCYKQKAPLFDPKQSSTYRALTCTTRACQAAGASSSCRQDKNICQYSESYGDRSFSRGDLAVETFTFASSSGQALSFPTKVFGCGFSNAGTFNESASGIIGLGGGPLSIVRQLSKVINGKFSYCLVDLESSSTSKIKFGEDAVVSGKGVVSTPIVKKEIDTFYYLTLESISVGNKRLAHKTKLPSETGSTFKGEEGNIIIDSGTTLTFLPVDLYETMEDELVKAINKKYTADPQRFFSLCYSDTSIVPPALTFNFKGGAKVVLPPSSTFVLNGDLLCLAMVPTNDLAIFGNLSQMNFLIGYDLEKSVLSFKPTDCLKQ